MTGFQGLDDIVRTVGLVATVAFVLLVSVFFVRTLRQRGTRAALLSLLSFNVTIPFLIVMGLNLLGAALVFNQPNEVGVVISFLSPGGIRPQTLRGGFHLIAPFIEQVEKYSIAWQTYTMSGSQEEGDFGGNDSIRARTSDGQEVYLDCSIIFRVDADQAVLVHIDWQHRYVEGLVRPVARGIVRREVSQFTADEVNSFLRRQLEANLDQQLSLELANKGFIVDQFLLRDITFSPEYARAVEEKQVALQAQISAEYEAERTRRLAQGRADAVFIEAKARSQALTLIGEVLSANKDLLTYRYIEELTPNIRVMLLPNNAPFILPLADLLKGTEGLTPTTTLTNTMQFEVSSPGSPPQGAVIP